MAAMIGRGKSWLWWLAGFLCALVFGPEGVAGEANPKGGAAKYGVPMRPAVSEEDQKKVEALMAECLAPVAATEPAAEAKAEIEQLVKDFGSADPKTREAASAAAVKHGPAALGALRAAAASKDLEVVERARVAVAAIETAARAPKLAELRKLGFPAQTVVRQKWGEANTAAANAEKAAADAEKAGKADEVEKTKAEAKAARERAAALAGLLRAVSPESGVKPLYGVMVQNAPQQ